MLNDEVQNAGTVLVEFFDEDKLANRVETHNLIVNTGLEHIAARLSDATPPARMSHMAIGIGFVSGTSPPLPTNLNLDAETARVSCVVSRAGNRTTYTAVFPAGVATGQVSELGIFNSAQPGFTMLARVAFSPQPKTASTTITVTWVVTQS